jgi:predicted nucleotidyltransferase component of viral defense system
MKLFEHPDFEQAILRATEHFHNRGLRAAIIEKDYYVTEALRLIATKAPDKIIFKGGTSLAKGWNLIQRFSEDIDVFLDPLAFKVQQELLRHADIRTTMNIYTHAVPAALREANSKVVRLVLPTQVA